MIKKFPLGLALLTAGLSGCATFQTLPLTTTTSLPHEVPHLIIDASQMPLPELARRRFDPSDGMDMMEVAMLAVVNNPDLKLARDDVGIAQAQAFNAGLLPDPQLSLSPDFPTSQSPGLTTAFTFGLSYDITALLTRPSSIAAAGAETRRVDLNLLWQEWQVVGQARLFFVRSIEQDKLIQALHDEQALFARRASQLQAALRAGNQTLDVVSPELANLQGIDKQANDAERQAAQNRHNLNALLGIAPDVNLNLQGSAVLPEQDDEQVKTALTTLANCRPDLQALQAGYASQDEKLRQAIITQFPALNIGVTRSRDTSAINSAGFAISVNLPVFNRNQGNIAIEQATRQRLHDEFQIRLDQAYSEIDRMQADQKLLEEQLQQVRTGLADLEKVAGQEDIALKAGNLDGLTYTNLRASLIGKRMEEITLEQSILEQRVALLTLLGTHCQ